MNLCYYCISFLYVIVEKTISAPKTDIHWSLSKFLCNKEKNIKIFIDMAKTRCSSPKILSSKIKIQKTKVLKNGYPENLHNHTTYTLNHLKTLRGLLTKRKPKRSANSKDSSNTRWPI